MRITPGRMALVLLVLLLAAASASYALGGRTGRHAVRGGTLRILSAAPETLIDSLDTAVGYNSSDWALERTYARRLYGYDPSGPPDRTGIPVPDMATGPPQVSPDRRTYTFTLRSGIHYAPPIQQREVLAKDFVTAVKRLYDKKTPSPGQLYANLIAGAKAFGDGKAKTIRGLVAVDPHTLRITLVKPAGDFLSILALPFFAPVPGEWAASYKVGANYSGHVVGTGPYTLKRYDPGHLVVLERNPSWDPASDPLRKAWVDRIEVRISKDAEAVQQAIERDAADLALDFDAPTARLRAIASDPAKAARIRVAYSGCERYLALETNPAAPATSDVRVRRAINYAVDKVAALAAFDGPGGYRGGVASTVLPPKVLGHQEYDLYPTPGNGGDPAKARELLAQAGYPHGLTLTYANSDWGKERPMNDAIEKSLARAGIKLRRTTYKGDKLYSAIADQSHRRDHQIAHLVWCPDWPGDSARSFVVPLLDGRLSPSAPLFRNYGEYDNRDVNRLIDVALAERDRQRQTALWSQVDRQVMRDAAWVPLFYHKASFFFSTRVRNWTFDPSCDMPDLTAIWLDPRTT